AIVLASWSPRTKCPGRESARNAFGVGRAWRAGVRVASERVDTRAPTHPFNPELELVRQPDPGLVTTVETAGSVLPVVARGLAAVRREEVLVKGDDEVVAVEVLDVPQDLVAVVHRIPRVCNERHH